MLIFYLVLNFIMYICLFIYNGESLAFIVTQCGHVKTLNIICDHGMTVKKKKKHTLLSIFIICVCRWFDLNRLIPGGNGHTAHRVAYQYINKSSSCFCCSRWVTARDMRRRVTHRLRPPAFYRFCLSLWSPCGERVN